MKKLTKTQIRKDVRSIKNNIEKINHICLVVVNDKIELLIENLGMNHEVLYNKMYSDYSDLTDLFLSNDYSVETIIETVKESADFMHENFINA